jgi:hypothetical protein
MVEYRAYIMTDDDYIIGAINLECRMTTRRKNAPKDVLAVTT